jgi:hypothetical protein
MPCCLVGCFALIGPRFAAVVWWLFDQGRWAVVFNDNIILPLLGILLVPWTTLAYVWVAPGGVDGLEWIVIGIGLFLDIGSWLGGYGNRSQYQTYYRERF